MKRNRIFVILLLALLALPEFSGIFAESIAENSSVPDAPLQNNRDLTGIARLTMSCITRLHYNASPLDHTKAEMAFTEYLKFLDPAKMYLTKSDIAEFKRESDLFAASFVSGDLQLAFTMYKRLLQRQIEYCDYAAERLEDLPADYLNGNDTYLIDRKKADWQDDPSKLPALWEKRLKNELIVMTLSDRATAMEIEKKKQAGETKDLPEMPKKTVKERILKRLAQIRRMANETESIDVVEAFLNAVAAVYDPHSCYFSPVSDEDFNISMTLKLSGIGAVLTSEDEYTKIVEVMPGGPADKDGRLQAGDRIIAVAQDNQEAEDITGMPLQKVVRKIRGPVGSNVTLTVIQAKNGINSVPVKIRLVRAEVVVKDSEAKGSVRMVKGDDGVERKLGVITLPSFYMDFDAASRGDANYKCASRDIRNILEDFKKQDIEGVIVDLRSNGGGSLPDVVDLCGLFIKDGPMVQVRTKDTVENMADDDGGAVCYAGPLLVMVNRLSASASEIFAGAIRDYGRGIVVGDSKTHGKGTVQTMRHLDPMMPFIVGRKIKGGSVKVTIAKFYRVNGESTQLKGVTPDIIFPSFFDCMDMGEDKLDNPLPWDTIKPARYTMAANGSALIGNIPALRAASEKRMAENPDFRLFRADVERFRKMQEKDDLSLNLEERWSSYQEEKKIADEQIKMFKLDRAKSQEKDLYLDECLNILNDMIRMEKK